MHGIAIAILKYGYLDDNTALSRYTQSVVAQITIRGKSGLGSETRFAIATNMHGVISKYFYSHFEFICQYI